jgi:hypothetical protein
MQNRSIKREVATRSKTSANGEHTHEHELTWQRLVARMTIETIIIVYFLLLKAGIKWLTHFLHMDGDWGAEALHFISERGSIIGIGIAITHEILQDAIWAGRQLWRSIKGK